MSSKTKTTSAGTSASTQQTSPTVPDWIANPTQTSANTISNLQAQGPNPYTPQESALQSQAVGAAGGLTTSGAYGQAGNLLNNIPQTTTGGAIDPVQAQSLLTNLSAYENPYQDQVINPVLQQYDYQAGQTQAAQAAQAAQGGAFGGSRYAIQAADTAQQLAMGRAQTQGGLLNQMYTQATGLSAQDAAARQAAEMANQQGQEFTAGQTMSASQANQAAALQQAGLLTNLGSTQDASARANLSLQDELGVQQSNLQTAQAQYPMQYQAQLESLLAGLNPSLYTGSTTSGLGNTTSTSTQTQNPGLLQALGTAAQAASLFTPAGGLGSLFQPFQQAAGVTSSTIPQTGQTLSNLTFGS